MRSFLREGGKSNEKTAPFCLRPLPTPPAPVAVRCPKAESLVQLSLPMKHAEGDGPGRGPGRGAWRLRRADPREPGKGVFLMAWGLGWLGVGFGGLR